MARSAVLSAALMFGARAFAAYDKFHFTSEETEWKCPKMGFDCVAPQVCAHESLLDKYYCCGPGSGAVCWAGSPDCGAGDGEPSTNQIGCSEGVNAFCCLKDREECTQRFNQINICWATPANPIANLSSDRLNETFSSLSSASPSASSWTLDPATLLSTSTPASSSATPTASSSASSTPVTTDPTGATTGPPLQSVSDDGNGISGGAIGGIVVGVVGGLAAIGGGAFFLWRRRKPQSAKELDSNPYSHQYAGIDQGPPHEKYAHEAASEAQSQYPPVEMDASNHPMEMEGSKPNSNQQVP